LVVPLAEAPKLSTDRVSKQWFSQDVFDGVDEGEELSDDEEAIAQMRKTKKAKLEADVDADGDMDMGVDVSELPAGNGSADVKLSSSAAGKEDFEIAPQEGDTSSDSDSESEDDHGKAEILAYAKKMLKKRSREGILDDAYNRYTFNDDNLPRWFAEDEKKHSKSEKPVTKEEVEAMKVRAESFFSFNHLNVLRRCSAVLEPPELNSFTKPNSTRGFLEYAIYYLLLYAVFPSFTTVLPT
jgi:AdoMet-dependent rRNA methyltransferase SPB1